MIGFSFEGSGGCQNLETVRGVQFIGGPSFAVERTQLEGARVA